jgi:hypothetical protein
MKHFSLTDWADFVRGMAGKGRKEAMQDHLDSGCRECVEVAKTWARVREAAKRERSYEPPESAVRMAKSHLAIHGKPGRASKVQLLFDSFQNPVIAGIRATATTARQMLYGIGTYRIDLRMEPQMDSDKVSLVGQILNSADPVKTGAHVTVTLLRGSKVLAESQTNRLGEFHLECSLEGQLQLLLALPRDTDVRIPLLVPSESAVTGHLEQTDSEGIKRSTARKREGTRKRVLS